VNAFIIQSERSLSSRGREAITGRHGEKSGRLREILTADSEIKCERFIEVSTVFFAEMSMSDEFTSSRKSMC
jgi:hypothetical protein